MFKRYFLPFFITFCLIFAAWTSLHFHQTRFITSEQGYQVSHEQRDILAKMPPTEITVFTSSQRVENAVLAQLHQLQQYLPTATIHFKNPNFSSQEVAEFNITKEGETLISNAQQYRVINNFSIAPILESLLSLHQQKKGFIVAASGDGERDFLADSGGSWRAFYQLLKKNGENIASVNLTTQEIPSNTDILIIADPVPELIHKQGDKIRPYIHRGGNILFSTDTLHPTLPDFLSELTGLELISGVVVDKTAQELGYSDPRLISGQTNRQIEWLQKLSQPPLFPGSIAFTATQTSQWQQEILLSSSSQSWAEKGPIIGSIEKSDNEKQGPLDIAWQLSRTYAGKRQSIIILGDSDLFVGNALSIAGNKAFALAITQELSSNTVPMHIEREALKDQFIQLSREQQIILILLLIFAMPIFAIILSIFIHRSFQKRYQL